MKLIKLTFIIFSLQLCAQNNKLIRKLDSVTKFIDERLDVLPGTSVIITKNNTIFYTAFNGLSSIELNTKNNLLTQYDLASIGKMFTGYSIASLEEQGKIAMEDDIRKYLPDFPIYDDPITVGHLVHHTSGIKNWTYLVYQMGWSNEDKISSDQLLRAIYAQKNLDFKPGQKYQYSNSGYLLLTKIIENITNKSFVQWTNQNIFSPLKMKNTFFNDDQNKVIDKMAQAYMLDSDGNRIREAYNTSVLGSSSLISNAQDMGIWMRFLLNPPKEKKGIVEKMMTTKPLNDGNKNNYAYGIEINKFDNHLIIGHSGSWSSFTSYMTLIPELNVGIFFANNYRTYTKPIRDLYLEVFFPSKDSTKKSNRKTEKKQTSPEVSEKEITLSSDVLDSYTGLYKLGDTWYLEITRKDNNLFTRSTGERVFKMKAKGNGVFSVRAYGNRDIKFKKNKEGIVDRIEYDGIIGMKKNTPFHFDKTEFQSYLGSYYSSELDVVYTIKILDGKMIYTNIKTGTFEFFFVEKDVFFSEGLLSKVQFDRDKENSIKGLQLTNSKKDKLYYFHKAN